MTYATNSLYSSLPYLISFSRVSRNRYGLVLLLNRHSIWLWPRSLRPKAVRKSLLMEVVND